MLKNLTYFYFCSVAKAIKQEVVGGRFRWTFANLQRSSPGL